MDYLIFSFSLMLVYIGLAQLLHVQFGLLGIPNFGVVGFWGLGLYGTGVLYVNYDFALVPATIVASLIVAVVSYVLASMCCNAVASDTRRNVGLCGGVGDAGGD